LAFLPSEVIASHLRCDAIRRLSYTKPDDKYAKFFSRSKDAVIRVYDEAGKVIETL
jgi:hypothetical protein